MQEIFDSSSIIHMSRGSIPLIPPVWTDSKPSISIDYQVCLLISRYLSCAMMKAKQNQTQMFTKCSDQ